MYARIKKDCWNLQPDVASILLGVNDVWHEFDGKNGVETERFDAPEEELTDEMIDELMAPFKEQQEKLSKRRERKKRKKYADI